MMVIKKPLIIFGNTGVSFLIFSILISIFQIINYFNNDLKPIQNTNLVLGFGITGIVFIDWCYFKSYWKSRRNKKTLNLIKNITFVKNKSYYIKYY